MSKRGTSAGVAAGVAPGVAAGVVAGSADAAAIALPPVFILRSGETDIKNERAWWLPYGRQRLPRGRQRKRHPHGRLRLPTQTRSLPHGRPRCAPCRRGALTTSSLPHERQPPSWVAFPLARGCPRKIFRTRRPPPHGRLSTSMTWSHRRLSLRNLPPPKEASVVTFENEDSPSIITTLLSLGQRVSLTGDSSLRSIF